eukprot:10844442-Prorocentrum_lima.AAC.1
MNWQLELVPTYVLRKHTPCPVVRSFAPTRTHGPDLDPNLDLTRWNQAASMLLVSDSTLSLRGGRLKE